ncbi:DUF4913 domain-containing protein [Arthrobacter sp. UYCu712]|uniref:DUF4913 domain-containing protein n=1 Tax=Arthrobacter sp. UYCu712 TaxID=3156340 RepID=UPI00339B0DDC
MAEEIGLFAGPGPDGSHTHEAPAAEPAEAPQLVFGSAEEFLHEQLLPTYVRDVDDRSAKRCMEWYFHPEAVSRVEALWRAWEHLRLDGVTGISVWWRDRADHPSSTGGTKEIRAFNAPRDSQPHRRIEAKTCRSNLRLSQGCLG